MPLLEKALLIQLTADDPPKEAGRVPVQFNPASLKLTLSNQVEGGETRGRQSRQFNGKSSTELSFDLHFDTADETRGDGKPRSVREKTALVEKFVLPVPEKNGSKKRIIPPKVRFLWGDLTIDGIISSLAIDFDLFASDGYPLRAKMGVSIKEQDAKYEIKQKDEAQGPPAPAPGSNGSGAPGQSGGGSRGPTDSTGTALDGESAADFAARMGLDPSAWRGLAAGLGDSLSLSAGLEIDFSSSISASAGIGVSAGIEAGLSVSLEASLGLEVSADASLVVGGSPNAQASAAFALTATGGVSAAINVVETARASAAASASVAAFAAPIAARAPAIQPGAQSTGPSSRGQSARPPLRLAGSIGTTASSPSSATSAPDPRLSTFGFGVPLRPLLVRAADERSGFLGGSVRLRPGFRSNDVPETRDPDASPWISLPADDASRAKASAVQRQRRPQQLCGCVGPCQHGGGRKCR